LCEFALAQDGNADVRDSIDRYVAAFNQGDLQTLADCWTEDALWSHADGTKTVGRDSIRAKLEQGLAGKGVLGISDSSIRMVANNVAVEEGIASLTLDGEVVGTERYEATHVATDRGWKIANLRDLPSTEAATSNNPNLAPLAWLEGEWEDESGTSNVVTRFQWARGNAFLIHHFSAEFPDQEPLEGVQVIGWDPVSEVIRSWLFDSDGTFGSGVWEFDGEQWLVRSEMVLPDGRIAKSANIYTPQDGNSFLWKSVGRTVGGELLPNIENLRIVRKMDSSVVDRSVSGEGVPPLGSTTEEQSSETGGN
jgi:uncharacterized protein (TIGR02246 family)